MQISSNELYTNGEYLMNNPDWDRIDATWKVAILLALMKKNNIHPSTVIEIGCGAGGNLVELEKKMPGINKLTGYDISPQAIELAKKNTTEKISFVLDDLTKFDVSSELLLIIDVIEHVDDFYGLLRKMKTKSQQFIFHIPLDLSCRTLMKPWVLLQQRRSVGHIHYFSKATASWALEDTGYQIIDWVYTKPLVDVEKARSFKRWIKKILRNISFSINQEWSVKKWGGYSIMVLVK